MYKFVLFQLMVEDIRAFMTPQELKEVEKNHCYCFLERMCKSGVTLGKANTTSPYISYKTFSVRFVFVTSTK